MGEKYDPRKAAVARFKERFKNYLKGEEDDLDSLRDRWTNAEIFYVYEFALKKGYRRGFEDSKHVPHRIRFKIASLDKWRVSTITKKPRRRHVRIRW